MAYRDPKSNPDNAPKKQEAYKLKLQAMNVEDLYKETKDKIWLSSYANNNPASCYHWQCDATYTEWNRRGEAEQYGRAHDEMKRECGC